MYSVEKETDAVKILKKSTPASVVTPKEVVVPVVTLVVSVNVQAASTPPAGQLMVSEMIC